MIRFDGVTVRVEVPGAAGQPFTVRTILDDVSLDLAEPRVAVIGANGSGKSTLLRLVNGLTLATDGVVRVEGLDPVRQGREVRRRVGFTFTDPLSQLVMPTAIEDVELSLRRTIRDRSARRQRARELLAERGLAGVADQSVHDLSGGERQLVALTAVLAVEPAILVADEPTTLLDLRNQVAFRGVLAALPQQVVVATHDLALARSFERVVAMDAGRVVADGGPEETISFYERLMA